MLGLKLNYVSNLMALAGPLRVFAIHGIYADGNKNNTADLFPQISTIYHLINIKVSIRGIPSVHSLTTVGTQRDTRWLHAVVERPGAGLGLDCCQVLAYWHQHCQWGVRLRHVFQLTNITLLWLVGLNNCWDCPSSSEIWAHVTGGNFHRF